MSQVLCGWYNQGSSLPCQSRPLTPACCLVATIPEFEGLGRRTESGYVTVCIYIWLDMSHFKYLYICMYIYMYIYIYAYVHKQMCVYKKTCLYTSINICVHAYSHKAFSFLEAQDRVFIEN